MGIDFFQTRMGHDFFENRLPSLIKAVNRLAEAVEKSNEIALNSNKAFASAEKSEMSE